MGGQEPGITPGSPHNPQVLSESGGLWVPAYCSRRQTSTGALGSCKCRRLLESRQNEATNFQALLSNSEPSVTLTRAICGVKSRTRAGRARSRSRVLTLRTRRLLHCAWERCVCLPGPQSDVGPAQTSAPALCPWWQRSPARVAGTSVRAWGARRVAVCLITFSSLIFTWQRLLRRKQKPFRRLDRGLAGSSATSRPWLGQRPAVATVHVGPDAGP